MPRSKARSIWQVLLPMPIWIYVTFITCWFCIRLAFFDGFWWLALLNSLALFLFVPLIVFWPLVIIGRQWKLLPGMVIPTALFLGLFGQLILPPKLPTEQPEDRQFTVMSFNILSSNEDYNAITNAVAAANPDIIGLQEIRPQNFASIRAALSDYPYTSFHTGELFHTVGVMSRWPIVSSEAYPDPPIQRGYQTTIEVRDTLITFIVAHLAPNNMPLWPLAVFRTETQERYSRRAAEIDLLRQKALEQELPTVLVCDCNMTNTSETYAQLHSVLSDSFLEAGWGLGRTLRPDTVPFPLQRIDYVWHSNDLQALAAYSGVDGGSDHRPAIAKLQFVP